MPSRSHPTTLTNPSNLPFPLWFTLFFATAALLSTFSFFSSPFASAGGNVLNVGLVLQGGPDGTKEGTVNAMALQGAKEACLQSLPIGLGYKYSTCNLHVLTPSSETLAAYSSLIPSKAKENDFLVTMGYFGSKAIQSAANINPSKLFGITDFEFTPPVTNIASILFSQDQQGFLAGLLAGQVAKTRGGKVAVIGGVDQPSVRRQVNGFGNGVRISCSSCQSYGVYAGTFDADPTITSQVVKLMNDKKVSVIYNAASIFGTMTLKTLTVSNGIYAIGSGSDEWITNWAFGSVPGSEHVLTSIQTDYQPVLRSLIQSVLRNELAGGTNVFFGVNTNQTDSALKFAPAHEANDVFNTRMVNQMQGYIKDLTTGKIKTMVDFKTGEGRASGANPTSVELLSLDGSSSSNSTSAEGGKGSASKKTQGSGGFKELVVNGRLLGWIVVAAVMVPMASSYFTTPV